MFVENVARMNGEDFESISAAIAESPNNTETTILLLTDTEESITIGNKKNFILDLNGHTLRMTYDLLVITNNGGKLVITNGTITYTAEWEVLIINPKQVIIYYHIYFC